MQAARRVDDDDVGAAALGGGQRVEDDGARVGALLVRDDLGADAVAPLVHLLDGGGAEGVGGGDDHLRVVLSVGVGELADARGLAGAVDADDEDDGGPGDGFGALSVAPEAAPRLGRLEDIDELVLEGVADVVGVFEAFLLDAALHVFEHLLGGRDAGVGADEQLFELFPEGVIDACAFEEGGEVGEPGLAGAFESLLGLPGVFLFAFLFAE